MHGRPKFSAWSPHYRQKTASCLEGSANFRKLQILGEMCRENDCKEDAESKVDSALLSWRQAEQSA
jgi:hypothetical protein